MQCDVLVCEEITQMEAQLWADVCKFALSEVAFVLCSDFQQFSAICERWVGCPVAEGALEASNMIQDLAGGNRLTLHENQHSDQELFDFYTSLAARPVAEVLLEARALVSPRHLAMPRRRS